MKLAILLVGLISSASTASISAPQDVPPADAGRKLQSVRYPVREWGLCSSPWAYASAWILSEDAAAKLLAFLKAVFLPADYELACDPEDPPLPACELSYIGDEGEGTGEYIISNEEACRCGDVLSLCENPRYNSTAEDGDYPDTVDVGLCESMKGSLHPGVPSGIITMNGLFEEELHFPGKGMPFIAPPICKPPFDVCMHLYPPLSFCVTKESVQKLYEADNFLDVENTEP